MYVRFGKFQKYTTVALWGRQAQNVIFFFKFATKSLAEKKGGLSPPLGRPGHSPLYKASPLIPSSFDLKKSTKNPEKREG